MDFDEKHHLEVVLREYEHSAEQYRATWTAYSQAMTISVSGILLALALAAKDLPETSEFFILAPFVLVAWFSVLSLQGRELAARDMYARELERLVRDLTQLPIPVYETGMRHRLYRTWFYKAHLVLVAFPFLLGYAYCTYVAVGYLHQTYRIAPNATYAVFGVLLAVVFILNLLHDRGVLSPGVFSSS